MTAGIMYQGILWSNKDQVKVKKTMVRYLTMVLNLYKDRSFIELGFISLLKVPFLWQENLIHLP